VVGTDFDESNQTKNYRIGDIIDVNGSTVYVPYTGATSDVTLGSFSIQATDIYLGGEFYDNTGSAGSEGFFLSVTLDGVKWVDIPFDTFVPYTGATGDVDLGGNNLSLLDIALNGTFKDAFGFTGSSGQILSSTGVGTQWVPNVNVGTYVPYLGATSNVDLGLKGLKAWTLSVAMELYDSDSLSGLSGQVLSSTGTGTKWIPSASGGSFVPYTGATGDVDLGSFGLVTKFIEVKGTFTDGLGDVGTSGQVLSSTSTETKWINVPTPDLSLYVPYTGATDNLDLGSFALYTTFIFTTDIQVKGTFTDGFENVGTSGQVLSSTSTETKWVDPVFQQSIAQASHGITLSGGIAAVADLQDGTNDVQQTDAQTASLAPDYWVIAIPTASIYNRIRSGLFTITGISAFMGNAKNIYLQDDGTIGSVSGTTKIPIGTIVATDKVYFYNPLKYVY